MLQLRKNKVVTDVTEGADLSHDSRLSRSGQAQIAASDKQVYFNAGNILYDTLLILG